MLYVQRLKTMNDDPYRFVTKENFETVKQILNWGIEKQRTPNEIAQFIADKTDIPEVHAKALVQDELIGAMGYLKDGNKTAR